MIDQRSIPRSVRSRINSPSDHVVAFQAEVFGGGQKVRIIGIEDAEAGLCGGGQVDGIGASQKDGGGKFLIDVGKALKRLVVGREPMEGSCSDVSAHLGDESSVSGGPDGAFAEFAMEGGQHLGLAVNGTSYMVGGG